jgi:rare lipoprotein A
MSFANRIPATVAAVMGLTAVLACALPAGAADSGGTEYDASAPAAKPSRHTMIGEVMRFRGEAPAGARVAVQQLEDGTWTTVATAEADSDGRYVARWRPEHIGFFTMRAIPSGGGNVRAAATEETVQVTVYRAAEATWFGRGLYGRTTACGQKLTPTLMGVAHKTLPCGTKVAFYFRGRTITVPVVDRGPFGAGLSWDLTYAAAEALQFTEVGRGTVGAVSLGGRADQ